MKNSNEISSSNSNSSSNSQSNANVDIPEAESPQVLLRRRDVLVHSIELLTFLSEFNA